MISFAWAQLTCSERGGSEKFKMKIYVSSGIRIHATQIHDRKVSVLDRSATLAADFPDVDWCGVGSKSAGNIYFHFEFFTPSPPRTGQRNPCQFPAYGVTKNNPSGNPDTWFRPPIWDLLMLQLLRPNSSNLPCLYSTFHLEYPLQLVLSRFCLMIYWIQPQYILLLGEQVITIFLCIKRVRLNWNVIVNDAQSATYPSHGAPCPARDLFKWLNTRMKAHISLWTIREHLKRYFQYLSDLGDTFLPLQVNEIKHDNSPLVIVVLDSRYD